MRRVREVFDQLVAKARKVRRNEPVRVFFQTYAVTFLGLATAAGVVTDSVAVWVILGGTALLGLPAGEMVRKRVTPVSKAQHQAASAIDAVNQILETLDLGDEDAQRLEDARADLQSIGEGYSGRHRA